MTEIKKVEDNINVSRLLNSMESAVAGIMSYNNFEDSTTFKSTVSYASSLNNNTKALLKSRDAETINKLFHNLSVECFIDTLKTFDFTEEDISVILTEKYSSTFREVKVNFVDDYSFDLMLKPIAPVKYISIPLSVNLEGE